MSKDKDLKVLKKVMVREELVALTGDYREAIILGQFIYWSQRTDDFDKYIAEENARISKFLKEDQQQTLEATNGWIYKTATELGEECMLITKTRGKSSQIGDNTILGYIDHLIENGWLEKRSNPKYKWDKTLQYRVNLIKVFSDLLDIGYFLQDYKVGTQLFQQLQKTKMQTEKNENADSKNENQDLKNENQDSKNEIEGSKNEQQYQKLHTETTTKTTTEIESQPTPPDPSPVENIWSVVCNEIKLTMSEVTFNTWIKNLELVTHTNGHLILKAPNDFTKGIVENRFLLVIEQIACAIDPTIKKVEVKL